MGEIKSWGVYPAVLTVDPMKDREYVRHHSSGYEAGGDSRTVFLSRNPLFHEPDVSFLLFDGAALRPQRGLEDMMQLDLIGDTILRVEHTEAMYFCRHAWVI